MALKNFAQHMVNFTCKLVAIDEQKLPRATRSGFICKIDQKLVVISAAHGINNGPFYIDMGLNSNGHSVLCSCGDFGYLEAIDGTGFLDVAWSILPIDQIASEMKADPTLARKTFTLIGYQGEFLAPKPRKQYGFAVLNATDLVQSGERYFLPRQLVSEQAMLYKGMSDGLHAFKISGKHKGDDFYKGCSGAPICDKNGKVVSLVKGGCESSDQIFGFPIESVIHVIRDTLASA